MASSARVADREEWDAHAVTLHLRRRAVEVAILWIVAACMFGFSALSIAAATTLAAAIEAYLVVAMMILPAAVTAGVALLAALATWWFVRMNTLRIEVGADRLRIGGRDFLLADVVDFRWQLGWFVVKMRDGTVYRSPELAPREPERLVELIGDAIPTREALEASRPDPKAVHELGRLLTTLDR